LAPGVEFKPLYKRGSTAVCRRLCGRKSVSDSRIEWRLLLTMSEAYYDPDDPIKYFHLRMRWCFVAAVKSADRDNPPVCPCMQYFWSSLMHLLI